MENEKDDSLEASIDKLGATATPWYVGAQNDALYIIAGRPPAKDNDYPVHDADRTVIAKIYIEADAQTIVTAVNSHAELVAALEEVREYLDDRADVNDGPDGKPVANSAMQLLQVVDAALTKAATGGE